MKSPALRSSLVAAVVLLLSASVALAEELTRTEYVERVEPICKSNTEANSRILKGVKQQVESGDLVAAGRRFVRASSALGKAVTQIAQVPRPVADAAKLGKWVELLRSEQSYLLKIGKALKAENKFLATKLATQLRRNNNKANNTVISFGFDECRIDSSTFI
jgi:hypothetical protein